MRAHDMAATAALGLLWTVGACGQPGVEDGGPEPATSAGDVAEIHPAAQTKPGVHRLGAGERRVKLLVLPANAVVEVDGVPVRRRDGAIELSGKVEQTYRVRLSRDALHVETTVSLKDSGASPRSLDLAALVRAARPFGRGILPSASTVESTGAEAAASATPAEPPPESMLPESMLPESMQGSARANEAPACVCPPATQVVISKCPTDTAAAARGRKLRGALAGDSFE
jgi:hypothetical protein